MSNPKCYVVLKQVEVLADQPHPIAVFKSEAEAERSATAHKDIGVRTWVEEVNYYA